MFSIEIKRFWWLGDKSNERNDRCLHGEVVVQIGEESLEDDCTVSAAALYHLRTLTEDHIACYDRDQMLPCCGHSLFVDESGESLWVCTCCNGTDWSVCLEEDCIALITQKGNKTLVPYEEYRFAVFAFADQVMAYYFQCQPKVMPEEDYQRDGYIMFWREWARRRGIAVEDTPIGGLDFVKRTRPAAVSHEERRSARLPHRCGGAPSRREPGVKVDRDLSSYPRIAVIGCPGSGKSTLARKIAETTGHPLIHLDYEHWQPGFIAMPRPEFIAKQQEWVRGERWIIDGNYKGTMEIRFAAADLVICLDLPRWLCAWRVIRRHGTQRPDMRPDVVEGSIFTKDFAEFFGFIWNFRKETMPKILALHEKYPGVEFVRVRSQKEVNDLVIRAGM